VTTELTAILDDVPGTLADLGGALGRAGINIEAIHVTSRAGRSTVQFVADDTDRAERALDGVGIRCTRREVLVVRVLDEPGALGEVALVMSTAGINIDALYVTIRGHVVLAVDDLHGATQVAGGLAVTTAD
jgi:hypothetical protein